MFDGKRLSRVRIVAEGCLKRFMVLNKSVRTLLVLGVVVVLVAVVALRRGAPASVTLPKPNGYADFRQAATMLSRDSGDWHELSAEALKALVATNAASLQLVRTGLAKGCLVPPYFLNGTNSTRLDGLAGQKRLAQAFCAESRLALLEGRTNDAARVALDCCRFGQKATVGGVLIDALVGIAIQAMGLACLRDQQLAVDAPTARLVAAGLEELSAGRESLSVISERERRWAREGRFGPPVGFWQWWLTPILTRQAYQKMQQKFQQHDANLRRAMLDFAGRAFEVEHGKPPGSARELVPDYLRAVPLDPASGKEMPLR